MRTTGVSQDITVADRALDLPVRAALRLASPGGAGARLSTVIFHRVLDEPDPLFPDEPDRKRFSEICGWLARWFNVLPLDEAVDRLARDSLPPRALCITFDDGYADNHDAAVPILRDHGLTATFFVATGFLGGGRMWNDTVVEALRGCRFERLDVEDLRLDGLGQLDLSTVGARRTAVRRLLGGLKYLPPDARRAASEGIAERAQASLPDDLMMTESQVRSMADAGMSIGAHTVHHPILAGLAGSQVRQEMERSKADLEAMSGRRVTLFAYPNGRPGRDYLARDVELARAVGFRAAVSTAPGVARRSTGVFELPRFTPWDHRPLRFGTRMLQNMFRGHETVAA